jgi:hypothetical protein
MLAQSSAIHMSVDGTQGSLMAELPKSLRKNWNRTQSRRDA